MRYHKKDISLSGFLIILMISVIALTAFSAPASAAEPEAASGPPKRQKAEKVTINFVDVDISSIVRIMSEITGKNFIFDEGLKGKITIIAPAKLTSDEALSLFVSALELKGFTMVPVGGAYKIIPSSQAKQSSARFVKEPEKVRAEDTYIVRLIPLTFISTQEAFGLVQPLVSRNGQVSVFGSRNALLILDTAANIDKILSILNSIDVKPAVDEPEIIYIRHAQAEQVAQVLKKEWQRRGSGVKMQGGVADDGVTLDTRLNAIILSGPSADRDYFKRFVSMLDIPSPDASSRINVYYLENAEADDLGKVLDTLTKATGLPGQGGVIPQELTGRITITPDKATNALIIMASPADFQSLVQVIEKLDRRPKQVFVEAMITEVTVDKAIELGNKWRLTGEKDGKPVLIGGLGTVDTTTIQSVLTGMAGLTLGGLGNFLTVPVTKPDGTTFNLTAPGFAALFSLSEFRDVVNVLSTPHILTSDNSDAEIIVGENVPFLSKIEREPTTTSQPLLQSIERKDVGIKLKIKPKISQGNFVKLDIYQEISAISPTTTAGAADLITTKRSAKTTVVVKNNQTVVIGGLIQNKDTTSTTKVPLLGDIPLLGWLFKYKKDQTQKTNLLVFITPYIIEDFRSLEELKEKKELEFRNESGQSKGDAGKAGNAK